jgi:hypothetical protein
LFQTVTISKRERRRLANIDFFVFWKSLPKRRIDLLRYSCTFKNALKSEPFVKLQKENLELKKMNRLLRQELEQVKEKNRCLSNTNSNNGNRLHHPINGPFNNVKTNQKDFTFSFRKIFGCALSFGLGKVKSKQSKV